MNTDLSGFMVQAASRAPTNQVVVSLQGLLRIPQAGSNTTLWPVGSGLRVLAYLVKTEGKHPVRKVIRTPLSLEQPQGALGGISEISQGKGTTKRHT